MLTTSVRTTLKLQTVKTSLNSCSRTPCIHCKPVAVLLLVAGCAAHSPQVTSQMVWAIERVSSSPTERKLIFLSHGTLATQRLHITIKVTTEMLSLKGLRQSRSWLENHFSQWDTIVVFAMFLYYSSWRPKSAPKICRQANTGEPFAEIKILRFMTERRQNCDRTATKQNIKVSSTLADTQ